MPLGIRLDPDGIYCPIFICDVCGEEIQRSGNYHYRIDQDGKPIGRIYTVHKPCNGQLEASWKGPGRWLWDELKRLPGQLAFNMGFEDAGRGYYLQLELASALQGARGRGANIAKELRSIKEIPPLIRKLVRERDEGCRVCGDDVDLTVDHIFPRAKGGGSNPENLQLLCRLHNREKWDAI